MKKVLAASAVAAALLAGSAASSFAAVQNSTATYTLGNGAITKSSTFALGGPTNTVETGSFVDYYNFQLGNMSDVTVSSITNTFSQMSQFIKKFTLTLFTGTSTAPISALNTTGTATVATGKNSGIQGGGFQSDNLGAGNYFLKVTGTTTSASYGGSLSISVSSVPLPSTVALFGVALAGLGVAGAMRRKSATSVA